MFPPLPPSGEITERESERGKTAKHESRIKPTHKSVTAAHQRPGCTETQGGWRDGRRREEGGIEGGREEGGMKGTNSSSEFLWDFSCITSHQHFSCVSVKDLCVSFWISLCLSTTDVPVVSGGRGGNSVHALLI